LRFEQLATVVDRGQTAPPYQATRDLKRLHDSIHGLRPPDRYALAVEIEHVSQ
jgi:hypothetical protein